MHLLSAEKKTIFETTVRERSGVEGMPSSGTPLAVSPVMTPQDKFAYDRDSLTVSNVAPRHRGKHY